MDLNNQDCSLSSSKLILQSTCRNFMLPGEEGFVRQPLPDRDYNLSPLDPTKPSIHVLVDDVIIRIMKYLPLNKMILCEIVCRRWQALLYVMFERRTYLNLGQYYSLTFSDGYGYVREIRISVITKILLFAGETLKTLSLAAKSDKSSRSVQCDKDTRNKLYLIIAQLCPNLEHLDLSNVSLSDIKHPKTLKDCNNLKCLTARNCKGLNDNVFKELISGLPSLEKLYVCNAPIRGIYFDILPERLKELSISCCLVSKTVLHKINKVCKNLEVLELKGIDLDKVFLEELGVNCINLRILKLSGPFAEVSDQVKIFTKLTSLEISAPSFELPNIADYVKDLEELHITVNQETANMIDFGKFTRLKNVFLNKRSSFNPFRMQELISLEKCRSLQVVNIVCSDDDAREIIKLIVKCCPEIKHIDCPTVSWHC